MLIVSLVLRFTGFAIRELLGTKGLIMAFRAGGLRALGGVLIRRVAVALAIQLTFSSLWSLITTQLQFLFNFNWNITDKEVDNLIVGRLTAIASIAGGTVGNAAAALVCGALPGLGIMRFNPAMGAYVLKHVGEEAAEELAANVAALIRFSIVTTGQAFALNQYKTVRKFLFSSKGEQLGKVLMGGERYTKLKNQYLSGNAEPYSFALAVENAVESIPNQGLRAFIEEFLEEFWEGCVEYGYVVANAVDDFRAQQRTSKIEIIGEDKIVQVTPNRSVEKEKIVLAGPEQVLKPVIVHALAYHQMMENRDIGTFVGSPKQEFTKAYPQSLRIVIVCHSEKQPPFGHAKVRSEIQIPDIDRSKLDWERIKRVAGGENGYLWGPWLAKVMLDTGRPIQCYGATKDAAIDRAKAALELSDGKIVSATATEELDEGERLIDTNLRKRTTTIYPSYFTIYNRKELLDRTKGRAVIRAQARFEEREERIDLWVDKKPADFEEVVARVLFRG